MPALWVMDAAMIERAGDMRAHIGFRDDLAGVAEAAREIIGFALHGAEILLRPRRFQMPDLQVAVDAMLCDPRLGLTELDEILLELIRPRVESGMPFLIVLTKADKLTRSEAAKVLSITQLQAAGGQVMLFSALKKQGVEEVAQLLWDWTHPAGQAATHTEAEQANGADADADADATPDTEPTP